MFHNIFNAFGRRASVWDATDGWASKEQAYWGSAPVELHNSGAAHYQQQDWLGTERMVTGYAGSVEGTYNSLPFGDGFQVTGSDPDQYHFGGLDYEYKVGTNGGALARYRMYYNTTGSWMSPDPSGVSYDFTNPQSFNRYSYTLNNPVSLTDPTGQFTCPACTAPIGIACPWCAVGAAVGGLIYDLGKVFCWWGCHHPAFHGSLKPRPNAQPWDENHIHWWTGANLATALGLPDEGCDFGACGGAGNALESGAASQGSCDSSQLTCILSSATPYIPYVSMALFSAKPFIQNTTSQGKCSDMRSSTFFCGYTCTFSNGEELPSVVYNKVQMRIGCGQWSCAVGFDATMNSTHLIVPGAFDWWTTAVNINSGTCVYPSNP